MRCSCWGFLEIDKEKEHSDDVMLRARGAANKTKHEHKLLALSSTLATSSKGRGLHCLHDIRAWNHVIEYNQTQLGFYCRLTVKLIDLSMRVNLATSYLLLTTYYYFMLPTYDLLLTTCYLLLLLTTSYLLLATDYLLLSTCYLPLTTYYLLLTSYSLLLGTEY